MIGVATPQPSSNYVEIANEFYRDLVIEKDIPDDLQLGITLDTTIGINKRSMKSEETIFIAFGLTVYSSYSYF